MTDRPIDRVFAVALDKGFGKDGKVSIRGLAKAAGIPHSSLIQARDSESGRLAMVTLESLARTLGTTVGHLIGETIEAPPVAGGPADYKLVPLLFLSASGLNPRKTFSDVGLGELADSILANGLLQNLVVRSVPALGANHYLIVSGERRYRALKMLAAAGKWAAGEANVPVKVIEADEAQHLAMALLENLQRADINPMEEAEAFAQLQGLEPERWTPAAIARQIGCSTPERVNDFETVQSKI